MSHPLTNNYTPTSSRKEKKKRKDKRTNNDKMFSPIIFHQSKQ